MRGFIHDCERRPAEEPRAVAAFGFAGFTKLLDELSITGEFQNLVIVFLVATDPDVIASIDENAVFPERPVESAPRPAPGLHRFPD